MGLGLGVVVGVYVWMGVTTARSIGRCWNAVFQAAGATNAVAGDLLALFGFEDAEVVVARSRLS